MNEIKSISRVLESLSQKGFLSSLKACKTNFLVLPQNIYVTPEDLVIEKVYRFEGDTDVDEEAILFAVYCPKHKIKATYLAAFGKMACSLDAAMMHRLK